MKKYLFRLFFISLTPILSISLVLAQSGSGLRGFEGMSNPDDRVFVEIAASTKYERSHIANLGFSIESITTDRVWAIAPRSLLSLAQNEGIQIVNVNPIEIAQGGHDQLFTQNFPDEDTRFHTYEETYQALKDLVQMNPDISKVESLGKTVENRDIWAIHINTSMQSSGEFSFFDFNSSSTSGKPGIVYLGAHHAREHLSTEIPLMFAEYLLKNRHDSEVSRLLESRDIWIIPIVNPDGKEWDISSGNYKMWRKNRRDNLDGTYGVDLNRNYDARWGQGGSSTHTSSDVYMGTTPFSEPETQAIKKFIETHSNIKILLSVHTFSELILYPWGGVYEEISDPIHLSAYKKMADTMAQWNKYKPQKSSDLYIATGDTCDWAYEKHGIFAFTFELSPKTMIFGGGFYPGAKIIDRVFSANLKPMLYLLDLADNPLRSIAGTPTGFLKHYVEPSLSTERLWN